MEIDVENGWKEIISKEFSKEYFLEIMETIEEATSKSIDVYPPEPFIGQDPYHNPGTAMGLSFSVPRGMRVPPSLRNIYKELAKDIEFEIPEHGDLTSWANQGVFLLNAMLTVEHKKAGSHQKIGWQRFTNVVIKHLSKRKNGLVFLLWGKFAQSKADLIDSEKHHILIAAHPSPLARNAFSGCRHFSQTNEILQSQGTEAIDWQL